MPRIFMVVFGVGAALAGLAGAVAGPALATQPSMAAMLGPILFVVIVVGGLGSLQGAFFASLLIGVVQTFAVAMNFSLRDSSRRERSTLPERSVAGDGCPTRARHSLPHAGSHTDLSSHGSHARGRGNHENRFLLARPVGFGRALVMAVATPASLLLRFPRSR